MITLYFDNVPIAYDRFFFSGGEAHIRLYNFALKVKPAIIEIDARLKSANDIMELLVLVDAIRQTYNHKYILHLVCPYLPYARQDRVCNPGEALSSFIMIDLINNLKCDIVEIWDIHNTKLLDYIDNVIHKPASNFAKQLVDEETVIVAPDSGAQTRAAACQVVTSLSWDQQLLVANKKRNSVNGEITGMVISKSPNQDISNKDFLMVDDICDGGKTFIELAKVLRPLTKGKINLYVTHGIFSKGLDVFNGFIDEIYTANPFIEIPEHSKVYKVFERIV